MILFFPRSLTNKMKKKKQINKIDVSDKENRWGEIDVSKIFLKHKNLRNIVYDVGKYKIIISIY